MGFETAVLLIFAVFFTCVRLYPRCQNATDADPRICPLPDLRRKGRCPWEHMGVRLLRRLRYREKEVRPYHGEQSNDRALPPAGAV